MDSFKKCSYCKDVFPATTEYFYRNRSKLSAYCKTCQNKKRLDWLRKKKRVDPEFREKLREEKKAFAQSKRGRELKRKSNRIRLKRLRQQRKDFTDKQWEECMEYFNHCCAYCGQKKKLHQEHFIPVCDGGHYTKSNILPSCDKCNLYKSYLNFFTWYPEYEHYSREREQRILDYLGINSQKIANIK